MQMLKRLKNKLKELQKKIRKKLLGYKDSLKNSYIYFAYYHRKIDEKLVFIESRDGNDFTGNMLCIARELSKDEYSAFKIAVFAKGDVKAKVVSYIQTYQLKRIKIISREAIAVHTMERAKYLFSDSSLLHKFVKRPGQIIVNTWHGTPLKTMGKSNPAERHSIGSVQRVLRYSDYLIYPSEYMMNTMLSEYMVENVYQGKALLTGYPRNEIFFDTERCQAAKNLLGIGDKQSFAYLPTFRGTIWKKKNEEQAAIISQMLSELDERLNDNQILYVKLHVFNHKSIDFSAFKHIKSFPEQLDTYEVLNAVDCLITDYSSVFFDFANTMRKVILFTYDLKEYFSDRGVYFPLEELPFPKVVTIPELIDEMNKPKEYDDTEFLARFCTYDKKGITQLLCRQVFWGEENFKPQTIGNGGENVLIFGGSLTKNGITTAFRSIIGNIDSSKRNYFASFLRSSLSSHPEDVGVIPSHIEYLPIPFDPAYTFWEKMAYRRYEVKGQKNYVPFPNTLKRLFGREWNRVFYGVNFSYAINFDGYVKNVTLLFSQAPCGSKTIFVHNDMIQEMKVRDNQHYSILHDAYRTFTNVAVVSPDLLEPTQKISGRGDNIVVVDNYHDRKGIMANAEKPIAFQKSTECRTAHPGGIEAVLNSKGKKFITIGRFSPEKGHQRLLQAFDQFCDDYPDTQLIIIGGHGILYAQTLKWISKMKHWENVSVIKSISNPMPLLKRCDLFVLSSLHEGLPMTIKEADTLGIPVIATDILGVRSFLSEHNGHLIDNSEEGILQGMYDFMEGKVHTLTIDYDEYNRCAVQAFESLFSDQQTVRE